MFQCFNVDNHLYETPRTLNCELCSAMFYAPNKFIPNYVLCWRLIQALAVKIVFMFFLHWFSVSDKKNYSAAAATKKFEHKAMLRLSEAFIVPLIRYVIINHYLCDELNF